MSKDNTEINLSFTNTLSGIVYDKDGNITDKISKRNILTDNSVAIFTKNLCEEVNEAGNSAKILGVILSDTTIDKVPEMTIDTFKASSGETLITPITSISYMGTGVLTYGARYNIEVTNSSGTDKLYKSYGLVSGFSEADTASHTLLSILNCNIEISDGGTFVGDYKITVALRRS